MRHRPYRLIVEGFQAVSAASQTASQTGRVHLVATIRISLAVSPGRPAVLMGATGERTAAL